MGTGEQPVLSTDGDGADGSFRDVVVDLEPTVIEEAGERLPSFGAIADSLRGERLWRKFAQGIIERGAQRRYQRLRPLLTDTSSDLGGLAPDLGFDGVKLADTAEQVSGERGRLLLVALEQLASKVRPAGNFRYAVASVKRVEPGVSVGLEEALEPGEFTLGIGLVTVLRRSPISLCHPGFECERADAAQIRMA
ncbi:hypothetical protein ABIE62_002834, partial [Porphyrobacter sp. MBR-155]